MPTAVTAGTAMNAPTYFWDPTGSAAAALTRTSKEWVVDGPSKADVFTVRVTLVVSAVASAGGATVTVRGEFPVGALTQEVGVIVANEQAPEVLPTVSVKVSEAPCWSVRWGDAD